MSDFPYSFTLGLLGGTILIRCKHHHCAEEIARFYASVTIDAWCTPDVIVDCDWSELGPYLFRARPEDKPGPLKGVRVHVPGQLYPTEWEFSHPPVPPFAIDPFRQRFLGIHAAAVTTVEGRALLVVGGKSSGKTTVALGMVDQYGCQLLTDETVCIHRRTALVEPFPRPMGVIRRDEEKLEKVPTPAHEACRSIAREPAQATHIICLEKLPGTATSSFDELSPAQAFRALTRHQLNTGCCADEAMVTLAQLARRLPTAVFRYCSYNELTRGIGRFLQYAEVQRSDDDA